MRKMSPSSVYLFFVVYKLGACYYSFSTAASLIKTWPSFRSKDSSRPRSHESASGLRHCVCVFVRHLSVPTKLSPIMPLMSTETSQHTCIGKTPARRGKLLTRLQTAGERPATIGRSRRCKAFGPTPKTVV